MSNLAMALKQAIEFVDAAVFPEKPLDVNIIAANFPPLLNENQPQFCFAHYPDDPNFKSDFYVIFEKGLEDYFLARDTSNVEACRIARRLNLVAKLADNVGFSRTCSL